MLAAPVFTRTVGPAARLRWMGPMAARGCATLTLTALQPGLVASIVIIAVSGSFATYQVDANTTFGANLPDQQRAQAFGIAAAGVVGGQGVAVMAAGAAAQVVAPSTVIAVSGGFGAIAAAALAVTWKAVQATPDAAAVPVEPR